MNWTTSFCQNTSPVLAIQAQEKLLRYFLKRSTFEVRSSSNHELNYVVIKRNQDYPKAHLHAAQTNHNKKERTLIMMHGFGTGLGLFYDNFDTLASQYDKIIAVDWLGMGCSSRTSTRVTRLPLTHSLVRCSSKEEEEKQIAAKVTDEFIDSLEELRKEEKIENFVLAGHSLGGYLVGKYALKYPKEVKGLILISPVGIPEQPAKEDRVDGNDLNWRLRFIQKLWQLGMTPQSLVRVIGSRGQDLVQNFITKRFSNRWEGEESKLISDYFYHITASPGNGEYCLNALLEPIFVKNRLKSNRSPVSANHKNKGEGGKEEEDDEEEDKLNESRNGFRSGVFAKNPLEKELAHATFPILLIYGDHDWLYYPGASDSIAHWRKHGVRSDLAIVPRAGHHLYLDNSTDFNQLILDWTHGIRY